MVDRGKTLKRQAPVPFAYVDPDMFIEERSAKCSHCGQVFYPEEFFEETYCTVDCGVAAGYQPEDFESDGT